MTSRRASSRSAASAPGRRAGQNATAAKSRSASPTLRTWAYLAIVALTAACGLVVEIVAGRMIAPYLGMSLYTWTAVIAVVLAGLSLGHWIGGRIADWPGDRARHAIAISLLIAGVSTAASLVSIRLLSGPVINLGLPGVPTILILTTVLFFPPSLFVGMPSPVLTKLAIENQSHRMGRTLGAFYAAGALGSIAGTLAAGYLFISWLGTIRTILLVAGIYIVLGAALLILRPGGWRRRETKSVLLPVAVTATLGALVWLAGNRVLAFTPNCDTESDYYCIRAVDVSAELGEPARVIVLDHLGHGINLANSPAVLVTPYMEAQDALIRLHMGERTGFRAFLIGGGAYTLPRAWLATLQDARITVSEIDPEVTRAARETLWLPDDTRMKIHHADARRVLNENALTYDVIVGDAFHDIAVPQHLVTREFFRVVATRLAWRGIYLMNIVDSHIRPRLVFSVAETLRGIFPTVEVWQSSESGERATFVVAAMADATPAKTIVSRVRAGQVWRRIDPEAYRRQVRRLAPVILTDDFAPVDRLIGVE